MRYKVLSVIDSIVGILSLVLSFYFFYFAFVTIPNSASFYSNREYMKTADTRIAVVLGVLLFLVGFFSLVMSLKLMFSHRNLKTHIIKLSYAPVGFAVIFAAYYLFGSLILH